MQIELLAIHNYQTNTGIGRYVRELHTHLQSLVPVEIKQPHLLPSARRWSFLKYLPIGIRDHVPGSIIHIPQIMGCAMLLWRRQGPVVVTVHDLGVLEFPEEWVMFDPVARQLLRLSFAGLKKADLIVAVSEFTRQGLIQHLGIAPERVVTVHSAIDHEVFRPITGARDALVHRFPQLAETLGPWLLYVGSELPRKNLRVFFEAVALLKRKYSNLRVLKVGAAGGEAFRAKTCRYIADFHLEKNVLFYEEISDSELALFYNAADLLIHPSLIEGFGFPVLEAAACGTPVVCSCTGSLAELAGNAAYFIHPENSVELADAVIEILENSTLYTRLVSKGIACSMSFNWQTTTTSLLHHYQALSDW